MPTRTPDDVEALRHEDERVETDARHELARASLGGLGVEREARRGLSDPVGAGGS